MQLEGVGAGDPLGVGVARALDQLVEPSQAQLERASEALLLGGQPFAHQLALLVQLRIAGAHQLGHALGVAGQVAGVQTQRAPLRDRPAHDPPQHVAAFLV
jgi:hypothetical protein